MSQAHPRHRSSGFTLLEVLVALVIVALGMSALLETLTQSARNIGALRDKTVAEWIALNQLALARLNLNAPPVGTTQGDVQNCANGNWHWQQQVNAVAAVPGLLSITVSVRRTGNASNTSGPPGTSAGSAGGGSAAASGASGGNTGATHPGASGQLGPNISLAPTAPLGSVTSLSSAECASVAAPGSSLGSPDSLGAAPGSLGAPSTLGGSPQLNGPSLGSASASATSGPAAGAFGLLGSGANGSGGSASSNGSDSSKSSSNAPPWLVTLTGFRGNSLGAAVGESPDWGAPFTFPGSSGTNPNGTQGPTAVPPSNSAGGVSSTPELLHAPLP